MGKPRAQAIAEVMRLLADAPGTVCARSQPGGFRAARFPAGSVAAWTAGREATLTAKVLRVLQALQET